MSRPSLSHLGTTARVAVVTLVLASAAVAGVAPATAHETAFAVDATVTPAQPTAGENATVAVTVSNLLDEGDSARVAAVELRNGTDADAEVLDEVDPNQPVRAGSEDAWNLEASFDRPGQRNLSVVVDLVGRDGRTSTIHRRVPVTVVDPHPSLAVTTDPVGPAERTTVALTVANGVGDNVSGLEVALSSPDLSLSESRRVASALGPGQTTTFTYPATNASAGRATLRATVSYTADGESRRFTRTLETRIDAVANPANVTLTGTRVEQRNRSLVVRGSASNPGSTNATGVVLRVRDGDRVSPGESLASFFVGDVQASDFSSFELHARLDGDVNGTVRIPIAVEFAADGERIVRETSVQFRPRAMPSGPSRSGGGGLPLVVGTLLVVGAAGIVGWRRYR